MGKQLRATATIHCVCGKVSVEAVGAPIVCVVCDCDDCQEAARQISSLPNAVSVEEPDGGTAYLAYRKDRVTCLKGAALLRPHKIRATSTTHRMIATCCNSAVFLGFDDAKHWVDLYRSRCEGEPPAVQMRICTRFRREGCSLAAEVPQYSRYPLSFLVKLVLARLAMLVHA